MNDVRKKDIQEIIKRIPYKELEGKSVLITGANGFIASYLVDVIMFLNNHYFKKKSDIYVLCRNLKKMEKRFHDYLDNNYFHPIIQSVEEKIKLEIKVDYVLHAAGSSSTKVQKESPVSILKSNVIGTYNLLEYVKDKKISSFLLFSSGAVYGNVPYEINSVNENDYFTMNFMDFKNCYAEGKRMAEHMCFAYKKEFDIPVKSIRIGHTYGPGINLYDGHVYSDFTKSICKNEDLLIHGTGKDVRPFCYITDAVVAIFLVLLKGDKGEAYNMANNNNLYSIYELAEKLKNEAFPERNLQIRGDKIDLKSNGKKNIADTSKLQALGWIPKIGVVEGFRRTVESFEKG